MPRSPRKFHIVPSKSGWKLFSELVNVKIITNVPQKTIFYVSFPFHDRKAATNSETVHFREHYQPPAAAILFSFALITHDPPTSAKSSICHVLLDVQNTHRRALIHRQQTNKLKLSSIYGYKPILTY